MILAVSKRWHRWRHYAARWVLQRVVEPVAMRLARVMQVSGTQANAQHDLVRMRTDICMKCPDMRAEGLGCAHCPCYMPAKRQWATARCSHPTAKRW